MTTQTTTTETTSTEMTKIVSFSCSLSASPDQRRLTKEDDHYNKSGVYK